TFRFHLMKRDGTEHKAMTVRDGKTSFRGHLSPDGKRVLLGRADDLCVMDIATGKVTAIEGLPETGIFQGHAWSPDGTKIAYAWWEYDRSNLGRPGAVVTTSESRIVVCDPDGKNAKTIVTSSLRRGQGVPLMLIDWR